MYENDHQEGDCISFFKKYLTPFLASYAMKQIIFKRGLEGIN